MSEKQKRNTLKQLRVQARLTQIEVEEITAQKGCRIPQSTLSDWETGKKDPITENILALAALYKVDIDTVVLACEYTKKRYKK